MNKRVLLTALCTTALLVPVAAGFAGCKKDNGLNINAKDVYALSASASANYLHHLDGTKSTKSVASLSLEVATTRPSAITDANVTGMTNCLAMFDNFIQGGGVNQNTKKNDEMGDLGAYTFKMTISTPSGNESMTMYYNETETETERKIEDEKEEVEVSSKLVGVLVFGDSQYDVTGEREFESEGDETEASIEFTTKSKVNPLNYIVVSQSVENETGETEIEYEYKIYRDGNLVQKTETEIENENDKFELEFKFKNGTTLEKTIYKMYKGSADNSFVIKYTIDGTTDTINVVRTATGYTFTYSNGYVEEVKA